ncbi:restriction endonuclease subunit S [Methylorubrum populi]|uniref:restriction endonuclease subunit S n=1 Tax=Methylorubrum populi TaxID=223967 RepID=UPI0031FA0C0A
MKITSDTVPYSWAITTVAEVGAVRLGRQRSPDQHTGKFATKYIRAANITAAGLDLSDVLEMDFTPAERDVFRLEPGDIVLAEASGSADQVGRSAIWRGEIPDCCFQNTVIRIRPHVVLSEYAWIVFRQMAESGAFAEAARGVGIQHLGAGRLAEMPFPLPPLAEQQRIVDEVSRRSAELDAAQAALNSARARTAEQDCLILEAAVTGALVETEAAIAAREGRSLETGSDLFKRTRANQDGSLFAGLDEVAPAVMPGWASPTVGQVGEVRLGRQRAPKFERGEHPTPYLRAANITVDGLDLSDILRMNFNPEERRIYELQPGDVLLTEASGSSAHVGRPAVWNGDIAGCCFQNTVIRFRPRACSSAYALLVFRHMAESGAFARAARGVGIQHLGASRFAALPFPLPPQPEQDRIVAEAETRLAASREQRRIVRASLARFHAMRREILAAAVAGRLVPQNSADETAMALLARLGSPLEAARLRPEPAGRENAVTKTPRRTARRPDSIRKLTAVLSEAGRAVPLPELFAAAGYDRDSAGDVERFYIALREEVGQKIEPASDARENAPVELKDAS